MTEFFVYLLKSGICLCLFYSLYWLFLKKETYFTINRVYLIFSIVLSFCLPFIHLTSPFFTDEVPSKSELLVVSNSLSKEASVWLTLLSIIYLVGMVVLLTRFIIRLSSLLKLIRKHGVRSSNGIKMVQIEGDFSPFSFFNSIFLSQLDLNDLDLKEIIAHELVHIRQYHSLDLMILEVLSIFQWFNPFVWPYKKSLKETHEYLADQGVIAQGFSPSKYQMLIVEHHVGMKLFEFANNFDRSQIKRRITMMTKIKSKNWSKIKVLLVIPAFLFLVIAFADSKPASLSNPVIDQAGSGVAPHAFSDFTFQSQDEQKEKEKKVDKKENLTEKEKKMIEELKIKYEKTDDPELKKKIKEKLAAIYAGKIEEKQEQDELIEKEKKLNMILEKTEDPKKREKIKLELKNIQILKEKLKAKEMKAKEEAGEKEKKK